MTPAQAKKAVSQSQKHYFFGSFIFGFGLKHTPYRLFPLPSSPILFYNSPILNDK